MLLASSVRDADGMVYVSSRISGRVCDTFALTRYTTTCRGPGLIGSLPFSSGSFSHQLANGPSGMSLMFSKLGAEKDRHVGPFLNICALANP